MDQDDHQNFNYDKEKSMSEGPSDFKNTNMYEKCIH